MAVRQLASSFRQAVCSRLGEYESDSKKDVQRAIS